MKSTIEVCEKAGRVSVYLLRKENPNMSAAEAKEAIRQSVEAGEIHQHPSRDKVWIICGEITRKKAIINKFLEAVETLGAIPSMTMMREMGVKTAEVKKHFNDIHGLEQAARDTEPGAFDAIFTERNFTRDVAESLRARIDKTNRYFVTTYVSGQDLDKDALASVKQYCQKMNAQLLILPCKTPGQEQSKLTSNASYNIPPEIRDYICFDKYHLNDRIVVSDIKIASTIINPTTGLARIALDKSFIFGSPKQFLNTVANHKSKLPYVLMSTGAISKPDYGPDDNHAFNAYLSKRREFLAEYDHTMGGIIVETKGDKYFYRQAQFIKGCFVDLGTLWTPHGSHDTETMGFFMGDLHPGEHCEQTLSVMEDVCRVLRPRKGFGNDTCNFETVSHWLNRRPVTRARVRKHFGNLNHELDVTLDVNHRVSQWFDEYKIVFSNHDVFLDRYMDAGTFMRDVENLELAFYLGYMRFREPDVSTYEHAIRWTAENNSKYNLGMLDNWEWLKLDEEYLVEGIDCGMHGHKGPNGSRGSLKNIANCSGPFFIGHSHTPGIFRQGWQVGTSTVYDPEYAQGPSSWMQTSGVIYKGGHRQLINNIGGEWRL